MGKIGKNQKILTQKNQNIRFVFFYSRKRKVFINEMCIFKLTTKKKAYCQLIN